MKKKLLAIILSAALVCAMLPFAMFSAFAVEVESGTAGDLTWSYDSHGILTISGTGAMPNYSDSNSNRPPWIIYYGNITEVVIESGVTSIGNYAFAGCDHLTSATIPDSVTGIGMAAFARTDLTSITIPASVTSIGTGAFIVPS